MAHMTHMPRMKALVDSFRDEYGSKEPWISEQLGLDRRALWGWWNNGLAQMPSPFLLHALARTIRTPYRDVLDAALHDFRYLPEATAAQAEPPPRIARKKDVPAEA